MTTWLGYPTDGKTDTAREASDSLSDETLARLEAMVFRAIASAGETGACCFEVEATLAMSHQTVSARITALHQRSVLYDSGRRRDTPSGRRAIVWLPARRPEGMPLSQSAAV